MQTIIKTTVTCLPFLFIFFALTGYAANAPLHTPAKLSDKAASSLLLDIVNSGSRLIAVGERGHIIFSEDNGQSWHQAEVPTSFTLTAVYFPSPAMGWAVGHDGIVLHSGDGGKTWVKQLDGISGMELNLNHARALVAAKEKELAQSSGSQKEKLALQLEDLKYLQDDYGYAMEENACCEPLMDLWFKNEKEGFVVGSYGQIYFTQDGGSTWTPWWDRVDNPDRLHFNAITRTKGALFMAGEAGTLYRSADDGKSWATLSGPYDGSYFGIIGSPEDTSVMAFGLGGNVAYSKAMGTGWKHIKTKAGAALSAADIRKDGTWVLISYSGVILSSRDESKNFSVQKIQNGWTGVCHADDGHMILVGIRGVHRVKL